MDRTRGWTPGTRRTRRGGCARGLGLAALMGIAMAADAAGGAPSPPVGPDVRRDATVLAVEKVLPAVVNIATLTVEQADAYEQMLREFFGYRRRPGTVQSSGSGVIIDEEGWVLTNHHVIRRATEVRVTLAGSTEPLEAEVVAVSEVNDLALLRLKSGPGQRFVSVAFASDDDLWLGETVIALGNPYGLGGSVSRGILSSKTRRPERDDEAMEPEDWLQTDASINPGNSGGPLINLRGELIGLNVAILANAQGIGFAIPVKRITSALAHMFSPEATRGLWLGALVRGARPPLRVAEVQKGSPADAAGLEVGDEVLVVNGKPVSSFLRFYREISEGGLEARVTVLRGERRREVRVNMLAESAVFNADYLRRRLGLSLEHLPEEFRRRIPVDLSTAMLVSSVDEGGPAARAGIAAGQFLMAIEGRPPANVVAVGRLLNRRQTGDRVVLDLLSPRTRGRFVQLNERSVEVRVR